VAHPESAKGVVDYSRIAHSADDRMSSQFPKRKSPG
jgi:hypothetical protein